MRRLGVLVRGYAAIAGVVPKLSVAYRAWFWMELFVQVVALTIFVFFWRAVYGSGTARLGGLSLDETLNYIMLAQILLPTQVNLVYRFGEMLVRGDFTMEMLRPLDLQARFYSESVGFLFVQLAQRMPLVVFAWLVFDLRLPSQPAVWGAFFVTLVGGHAVLFLVSWIFACLAFYVTEGWGLGMMQYAVTAFFSGALVPLSMMPDGLRIVTLGLPFAQGIYVPVSLLSGVTPLAEAPALWLVQLAWLTGLLLASRLVFRRAVRKITIHGG